MSKVLLNAYTKQLTEFYDGNAQSEYTGSTSVLHILSEKTIF